MSLLQNCLQFLFCYGYGVLHLHCNSLSILHGKPKSYQFFFQLFIFNPTSPILAQAHFSNSHNKTWKSTTLLIFDGKMSYGHSPHSLKKLPLFIFNVGLISNHVDVFAALKSNNSILPLLILTTFLLWTFSVAINVVAFAQLISWPFSCAMSPLTNQSVKSLLVGVARL